MSNWKTYEITYRQQDRLKTKQVQGRNVTEAYNNGRKYLQDYAEIILTQECRKKSQRKPFVE